MRLTRVDAARKLNMDSLQMIKRAQDVVNEMSRIVRGETDAARLSRPCELSPFA